MADQNQEQQNQNPDPLKESISDLSLKLGAGEAAAREFRKWSTNGNLAPDQELLDALSDLAELYLGPELCGETIVGKQRDGAEGSVECTKPIDHEGDCDFTAEPQSSFYPRSRYGSKL